MAEPEINAFLTHLAIKAKVSASTQNQALSAILFLYRHVLGREVGALGEVIRARGPKRLPVVLTREEVNISKSTRLLGLTGGPDARGSESRPLPPFGRQMADGLVDVRRGIAPDGMPAVAGAGH